MSQANREGKQNARERVAAEKLRQRKAARRRKQYTVSGVVVAVVALTAGIAVAVNAAQHSQPYLAPVGAIVDPTTKSTKDLGILVGSADAPVKMTVYEDFRCPICQEFETSTEATYKPYVAAGKVQITYHPVRIIDGHDNGTGSMNAGNAAACAQDYGQFTNLHDLIYANQPDESTDTFSNKTALLNLANQIPALKSSAAFVDCVNKGTHNGWVQANHDAFIALNTAGTPTLMIDGALWNLPNPPSGATQAQANAAWAAGLKTELDTAFAKDSKANGGKAGTPYTFPASGGTPTAPSTPAPSTPAATPVTPTSSSSTKPTATTTTS